PDSPQLGRPLMCAVPDAPNEIHSAAIDLWTFPTITVHRRQPVGEDVDAGKLSAVEDVGAALAGKKAEPLQHDDARHQLQSVTHEAAGVHERRIGEDRLDTIGRSLLVQEIDTARGVGTAIVLDVGGDHTVASLTEQADDGTRPTCWLPDHAW